MKKIYALHGHDNSFKTTITAIAKYFINGEKTNNDEYNILELQKNINGYKILQLQNILHFADELKRQYYELTKDKKIYQELNKTEKEQSREKLVEFAESQKQIHGNDIWAIHLLNKIKKDKFHNLFWIGDLRFETEYSSLVRLHNSEKYNFNVKFININVDTDDKTYYKKDDLKNNMFNYTININNNKSYNEIIKDIYYQLKSILC